MIYRVVIDGIDIYNESPEMTLISPSVDLELNNAGSFDFTMPPEHTYYSLPKLLTSDVEVYENNRMIFYGRPVEITTDFFNQKQIHCEGALAFLNDTIQRPHEWASEQLYTIFSSILQAHNDLVPDNRKIVCDPSTDIDKADAIISRSVDYETTKDALFKNFRDVFGGYFMIERSGTTNRLKWMDSLTANADQPAQYALNITEIEQRLSGDEIATAVIPIGDNGLTIKDVNAGYDYVSNSTLVAKYGLITKKVDFGSISDATELKTAGEKWLVDEQFEGLSIEVDVAELSYLEDYAYQPFHLGQNVHCVSTPHGIIDKVLPITKYSVELDSAVKKITIGTQKKEQLTDITNDRISSAASSSNTKFVEESMGGSAGGEGGSYDDTALKRRVSALEQWVNDFSDQDTVYDDTEIQNQLTQLQNAVDSWSDSDTVYDDSELRAAVEELQKFHEYDHPTNNVLNLDHPLYVIRNHNVTAPAYKFKYTAPRKMRVMALAESSRPGTSVSSNTTANMVYSSGVTVIGGVDSHTTGENTNYHRDTYLQIRILDLDEGATITANVTSGPTWCTCFMVFEMLDESITTMTQIHFDTVQDNKRDQNKTITTDSLGLYLFICQEMVAGGSSALAATVHSSSNNILPISSYYNDSATNVTTMALYRQTTASGTYYMKTSNMASATSNIFGVYKLT